MIAALATVVVLLLARPVKDGVQSAIERVLYRDRYDYRRALVSFARDLNTDLDLDRLAERLLARVKDTLLVDRLCLMLGHRLRCVRAGAARGVRPGTAADRPRLGGGRPRCRRDTSCGSTTRWPAARLPAEDVEYWRDAGLYYFVPCVSKGASSRCSASAAARTASR